MKKALPGRWSGIALKTLAIFALAAAFAPLPARADLREMSVSEMSDITGTGFSMFTVEGNRVRADFNILAETYTEIDSLKMGYWENADGLGWDQNWTQVKMGTPAQDMTMRGFFLEATFDHLSDPVNRRLTGVFFGFREVTGELQANFESLSRIGVGGDEDQRRLNPGLQTFQFSNSELRISFQLEGENKGIWVRFGEGTSLR
jgi:hypothetical protein